MWYAEVGKEEPRRDVGVEGRRHNSLDNGQLSIHYCYSIGAPTRTRTWNPLIKRVECSRHCESRQTASAVAVESGADKEQSRHFTREQLDEMSRFQTIDIHTTRKIRTIKFGLVDSDSLHSFLT